MNKDEIKKENEDLDKKILEAVQKREIENEALKKILKHINTKTNNTKDRIK